VLAALDNADRWPQSQSKADIEYAKADLAEAQRQERLQEDLYRAKSARRITGCCEGQVNLAAAHRAGQGNAATPAGLSGLHDGARAVCGIV